MNLFENVKENISVRQAAEYYGLKQNRNHMACCPFHNDRHPSLKLNENYYYCFGCGVTGDVIDFVARLFGLTSFEAAKKLSQDFDIDPDPDATPMAISAKKLQFYKEKNEQKELKECHRVLCDYLHLLEEWKVIFAPSTPEEDMDDHFVEACEMLGFMEYLTDYMTFADETEQISSMKQMKQDGFLQWIKDRLHQIEMEDTPYDEPTAA